MNQKKTVKITIELPMEFPEEWDNDMIEWYLNDGTYCLDGLINDLYDYSEEYGCICQITKCEVID